MAKVHAAVKNAVVVTALLVASAAMARSSFEGANGDISLDCGGDSASVSGASNTVSVTGECKLLEVEGSGNRVTVHMAKGGTIHVVGATNEIYWNSPDGSAPRVSIEGVGNRVARLRK